MIIILATITASVLVGLVGLWIWDMVGQKRGPFEPRIDSGVSLPDRMAIKALEELAGASSARSTICPTCGMLPVFAHPANKNVLTCRCRALCRFIF